jgi:hypothetical protein
MVTAGPASSTYFLRSFLPVTLIFLWKRGRYHVHAEPAVDRRDGDGCSSGIPLGKSTCRWRRADESAQRYRVPNGRAGRAAMGGSLAHRPADDLSARRDSMTARRWLALRTGNRLGSDRSGNRGLYLHQAADDTHTGGSPMLGDAAVVALGDVRTHGGAGAPGPPGTAGPATRCYQAT